MRIIGVTVLLLVIVALATWDARMVERVEEVEKPHPEAQRLLREASTQPIGEFVPSRPAEW